MTREQRRPPIVVVHRLSESLSVPVDDIEHVRWEADDALTLSPILQRGVFTRAVDEPYISIVRIVSVDVNPADGAKSRARVPR